MAARRLTLREQQILAIAFFVAFAYFNVHFIFRPLKEKITALENNIRSTQKRFLKNKRIIKKEEAVESEYAKHALSLKQKASDEQEMASILSEVEAVANQLNMRIADMKPNKVKRVDFYNSFSVNLTIEGELATTTHFLYALQNTPHLFKVDEIYFERSSFRASELRCRLILSKALIP